MGRFESDRGVLSPASRRAVDTATKVRFLRQPACYPDSPLRIKVVETHFAWVFLTGDYVYKFKKPIKLGAVDFTSLAARRQNCELEVQLNRRRAAPTYLGVVALSLDADRQLRLEGSGEPIEWLVKMRQLPAERMLDAAATAGAVTSRDIDVLVEKLVRFYRSAPVAETDGARFQSSLSGQLGQLQRELLRREFGLDSRFVSALIGSQARYLEGHPELFNARVAEEHIREVHGDLKPEHICLGSDPQIIDCLEFDRKLRILDCVEELAFLAMECARLGAPWLGKAILQGYQEMSGDYAPPGLLRFYLSQRAAVRAMLAVWHLQDAAVNDREHWISTAQRYLRRAYRYLRRAPELLPASVR